MPEDARAWLEEDGAFEDATTRAVIPEGARATGRIHAKQEMVVAGTGPAQWAFEEMGCEAEVLRGDGQRASSGELVLEVQGPARGVLGAERVALNLLMRLSGIATATAAVVEAVAEVNPSCQVLATRKTTPGLRDLEHAAVVAGGGAPHREDLASAVLVKENHLRFVTVAEAVEAARLHDPGLFVMVEAEDLDEAMAVARAGADGVLLDNFPAEGLEDVVEVLKLVDPSLVVEASGNLTVETVGAYARHADRVSLGSITHSAPAVDLSMEVAPAGGQSQS